MLQGGYIELDNNGGSVVFVIEKSDAPEDTRSPVQRIGFTMPQLVSTIQISDHRAALLSYAGRHALQADCSEDGSTVTVHGDASQPLSVHFDSQRRLSNVHMVADNESTGRN